MEVKRKNQFVTSDLHLEHANVIIYDKRPFKDLDHMHRVIINNFNACVSKDDITYFLGDVGMGKGDKLGKLIGQLNGTKVLVLGNHDLNPNAMYARGFDVVVNSLVVYIAQKRVSMSHCPLPGIFREDVTKQQKFTPGENWHGEKKNQRFTSHDLTVDYHLHGHIHSDNDVKPRSTDRQYDVGVRANGYRPVSFSQIESWIALLEQAKAKK